MRAHRFVMFETIKTRSVVSNRAPAQHQAQHQARCGMVKKSPKQGGKGRGTSHLCWPPYCIISHGQHLASQPFPPDTTQYPHLKNVLSCCPTGQNTSDVLTLCSFEANCPDCSLLGDTREQDDEWVTTDQCPLCSVHAGPPVCHNVDFNPFRGNYLNVLEAATTRQPVTSCRSEVCTTSAWTSPWPTQPPQLLLLKT